jgi:predicted CXXCH cytochrome family protein
LFLILNFINSTLYLIFLIKPEVILMKRLLILFLFMSSTIVFSQHRYIGVETGMCGNCHNDIKTGWTGTLHADAQALGSASEFWGYSCLQCHNTGWDPAVDNGGADEYVQEEADDAYTITDQINFDRVSNVQCEVCHGPIGKADGSGVDFSHTAGGVAVVSLDAELCGQCHTDVHHPTFEDWSASLHAVSKTTSIPGGSFDFIASDPECAGCHTAEGFLQFLEQTEYVPNVEAPGLEGNDITCAACHDPHSAEHESQTRLDKAELCQKCHNPEFDPDSPTPDGSEVHHSTAFMFEGKGGWEYEGYTYQNSLHTTVVVEKCVTCHVHSIPYQGGDPEIPAYTGHTFTPNQEACKTCHGDFNLEEGDFDYRDTQTEIMGLLDDLADLLAAASPEDSVTDAFYRAKYNHDFVEAEGSFGIHNTKYARGLLESAIANFTPTAIGGDYAMPSVYSLEQNYPNPFNPSTVIKFSIPQSSNVTLTIYDAIGNEIATLVNETKNAGVYEVEWNASGYSSGIYLYQLYSDQFVQVKKMLLIK